MNTENKTVNVGPSFPVCGVLGIAFIVLKLCGVINWSWWWVLAPFWGPIALFFTFLAAVVLVPLVILGVFGLCKIVKKLFS